MQPIRSLAVLATAVLFAPTGCGGPSGADAGTDAITPGSDSGAMTDAATDATPGTDGAIPADSGSPNTGYEGFGAAVTTGAESSPTGYTDYHVTSLADDGSPGTLRDALSAGERYILFDVAGTIVLQSDLNIRYSYVTIDGASAPSPGITIEQPGDVGTTIEARASTGPAHDILIHHLRMKGLSPGVHLNVGDIWGLDGADAPVSAVIIDHVTASGSTDGIFDIWGDVSDVTLSWNLITDTVTMLHLSTADLGQLRERISVHHNVFARNNERQIRFRHYADPIDYVNNVVYGWGWWEAGAAGLHIVYDAGEVNPSLNVEDNVFHFVSGLSGVADDGIRFERGTDEGTVYFSGNILDPAEADAVSTGARLTIAAAAEVTHYPADALDDMVVPFVGTVYRSPEEQLLLDTIGLDIP